MHQQERFWVFRKLSLFAHRLKQSAWRPRHDPFCFDEKLENHPTRINILNWLNRMNKQRPHFFENRCTLCPLIETVGSKIKWFKIYSFFSYYRISESWMQKISIHEETKTYMENRISPRTELSHKFCTGFFQQNYKYHRSLIAHRCFQRGMLNDNTDKRTNF